MFTFKLRSLKLNKKIIGFTNTLRTRVTPLSQWVNFWECLNWILKNKYSDLLLCNIKGIQITQPTKWIFEFELFHFLMIFLICWLSSSLNSIGEKINLDRAMSYYVAIQCSGKTRGLFISDELIKKNLWINHNPPRINQKPRWINQKPRWINQKNPD